MKVALLAVAALLTVGLSGCAEQSLYDDGTFECHGVGSGFTATCTEKATGRVTCSFMFDRRGGFPAACFEVAGEVP